MASAEQVTELITLMQQQMTLLQQQRAGGGTQVKRADRPVINADIDDQEWAIFLDTWPRYKSMAGITDVAMIRNELRAACSPGVNKMLFEFVGPTALDECTEEGLLAHIKAVAVKQVHHEVHQMNFHSMMQEEGESITHYVSRLKAQAFLCKFEVECGCDPVTTVSYADKAVAQRLVAGLCNIDHKRRILADASTLVTLDQKVTRLQLLETTDKSAGMLHQSPAVKPSEAALQRSQYKKDQRASKIGTGDSGTGVVEGERCRGCGAAVHPGGRPACPAFKKKCHYCKRKGHLAALCERDPSRSAPAPALHDSSAHDEPFVLSQAPAIPAIPATASTSFSFSAQDFRTSRNHNGNT